MATATVPGTWPVDARTINVFDRYFIIRYSNARRDGMTWVAIGFRAISKEIVNPDLYHVPASKIKMDELRVRISHPNSFNGRNNKNTNIAISATFHRTNCTTNEHLTIKSYNHRQRWQLKFLPVYRKNGKCS